MSADTLHSGESAARIGHGIGAGRDTSEAVVAPASASVPAVAPASVPAVASGTAVAPASASVPAVAPGTAVAPASASVPAGASGTAVAAPEAELLERDDEDDLPADEEPFDDVEDFAGDACAEPVEAFSPPLSPLPRGTEALTPFLRRPPEKTRDSLHAYLREINHFPLLKPDEESELARRIRDTGDPDAAFRLIASHLRLVVRIAMDFQRRWMQNVLDLVQEGNVGLVRAVSKFDPDKGIKFSYYAAFWIKAYILKFIMDNWRMVKIGTTQTQRKLFYNLNRERRHLTAQGFDADSAALAERLNVPEDQVIEMEQRLGASDMSLDAPVSEEHAGGTSRMDCLPALGPGVEATLADAEMAHLVRERLASLKPRLNDKELYILEKRLLADEPVTLREIGDHYSVTRERVRQIEARLLQKIRDHLFKNIKDFSRDWIE